MTSPSSVIKQVQKKFSISYIGFWVIPKITPAKLCKPLHDIINYSTSICPFESGKSGKEEEKIQKIEYLENKKSFLDDIKNIFRVFEELSFLMKNGRLKL